MKYLVIILLSVMTLACSKNSKNMSFPNDPVPRGLDPGVLAGPIVFTNYDPSSSVSNKKHFGRSMVIKIPQEVIHYTNPTPFYYLIVGNSFCAYQFRVDRYISLDCDSSMILPAGETIYIYGIQFGSTVQMNF